VLTELHAFGGMKKKKKKKENKPSPGQSISTFLVFFITFVKCTPGQQGDLLSRDVSKAAQSP
jgi:hypothetical protein